MENHYLYISKRSDGKIEVNSSDGVFSSYATVESEEAFRTYCESTPAWATESQDYVHVAVTSVNEDSDEGCKVYPNPANSMICVEAECMEQVTIFNVMGQVVYQQRCSEDGVVISVSDFVSGIYTMSVKTAQGTMTKRFSVIH